MNTTHFDFFLSHDSVCKDTRAFRTAECRPKVGALAAMQLALLASVVGEDLWQSAGAFGSPKWNYPC